VIEIIIWSFVVGLLFGWVPQYLYRKDQEFNQEGDDE